MKKDTAIKSTTGWIIVLTGLIIIWPLSIARSAATPPLPTFNAEYSLQRNGVAMGTSTRSLSARQDGTYIYASATQASGIIAWFVKDSIEEQSKWMFDGTNIRPLEYTYNRYGGNKNRRIKLHFDWQRNIVTNSIDGDPWRMEIPPNTQDKLVYQMAIMYDLMNGRKNLNYKIADGGKLKDYSFEIIGEETLDTELGMLKTVRIQRVGDKRDTTVWCAPQLSYLPVRLVQQDVDGSELSMQIISLQGIPIR